LDKIRIIWVILPISMKFSKFGQLHSNLGEVRNVSINWKNLREFQQT